MNLIISLRSEVLKSKRTAAFYFTLVGAAAIPFILLLSILTNGLPGEVRVSKNPLDALFYLSSSMNGLVIFPLFIVLICTLLPQIEFRNATWKQVLTSPQKKEDIFVAKFLNVHLLLIMFLLASHLFTWIVVIVADISQPQYNILNHAFDAEKVLRDNVHNYLAGLAICAIQFWIGLRSKNFIVPVAIGLVLWLVGTFLVLEYQSSISPYFLYSFPAIRFSKTFCPMLNQVEWTSFVSSFAFLMAGLWDFGRRRMMK